MYLNRLEEGQKLQFLNLCNLLVSKATNKDTCIKMEKIIQDYCKEMEIPYLSKMDMLLKQTAFRLKENGGLIPVVILFAYFIMRVEGNNRGKRILRRVLKFADMKESDEKVIWTVVSVLDNTDFYEEERIILYSLLNEEQKKQFMILCNLYDEQPDKIISSFQTYGYTIKRHMDGFKVYTNRCVKVRYWNELEESKADFRQIAFELAETSSQETVCTIVFALTPLTQLVGEEEDLKHFLVYADIGEEKVMKFRTLNDQFTSIQNEIGFQKLYTLNEEQKVLVLSLCKFFIEKGEDELRIFDVYSRKMEINSVITGETPIKRVIFELAETGIDMETVCALALLPIWIKRETSGCHSFYGSTGYTADTDWMSDCLKYAGVDKAEFSAKYLDEDGLFHRLINVINEVYQEIGIKDYPQ